MKTTQAVETVSAGMSHSQILAVFGQLKGFEQQDRETHAAVSPLWGYLRSDLPAAVRRRISDVIHLRNEGDVVKPEKTLIRLTKDEQICSGGRCYRTIKLKGISRQLQRIKHRERRHIRLLGRGDIPCLVPYLDVAGEERFVAFDVGEPYGAKRLRSVINEVSITLVARAAGCATLLPLGAGFFADPDLEFKGEPAAFSIWGVEHPDDERFDQSWRELFSRCRPDPREAETSNEAATRRLIGASIDWTRRHLHSILLQARRFHAAGLVHHELQFDNHAFYGDSLSVLDWEEAALAGHLTRAQFMESVLIDLFKLVCFCCAYEREFSALCEQFDCGDLAEPGRGPDSNWLEIYFDSRDPATIQSFAELLPMGLRDVSRRGAFRAAALPRIQALYHGLSFGSGIDWNEEARPFLSGFGAASPAWQPHASTTFDMRLFKRKGNRGVATGADEMPDDPALHSAETAVHEGRFEDALQSYRALANAATTDHPLHDHFCHNAASLCFALRHDDEAAEFYRRAYG